MPTQTLWVGPGSANCWDENKPKCVRGDGGGAAQGSWLRPNHVEVDLQGRWRGRGGVSAGSTGLCCDCLFVAACASMCVFLSPLVHSSRSIRGSVAFPSCAIHTVTAHMSHKTLWLHPTYRGGGQQERKDWVSRWVQNMCAGFVACSTCHLIDTVSFFCMVQACFWLREKNRDLRNSWCEWGGKSGLAAVEGTGTVGVQYGLVHSTGDPRKDTSLPYILHQVSNSGRQPFSHSPISPCAAALPFLSNI